MMLPFEEDRPSSVYLGVLQCLRHLIPDLSSNEGDNDNQAVRGSFGSHDALRPGSVTHVTSKNQHLQVSIDESLVTSLFTTLFISVQRYVPNEQR